MKFELKPYNKNVPDDELLSDLIKVAKRLNTETLKMQEYDGNGKYSSATIMKRFNGWNNALELAGLKTKFHHSVTDIDLLEDLKRVSKEIAPKTVTITLYNQKGKYGTRTIQERLGGWNNALKKLNLEISHNRNISEEQLFNNLETVWIKLGYQPGRRDMIKENSLFSETPYIDRFGSWRKALEAFIKFIDLDIKTPKLKLPKQESIELVIENNFVFKHKTKRDISARLKVQVLIRDGNTCRLCGVTVTGDNIHIDHIKPWSKEGETVLENLQVLCSTCNLAKGNFYD
jgi:hypothetical protein